MGVISPTMPKTRVQVHVVASRTERQDYMSHVIGESALTWGLSKTESQQQVKTQSIPSGDGTAALQQVRT